MSFSEKYGEYVPEFWEDFVGHNVSVDCKSWPKDFAMKTWGPSYIDRLTTGQIISFSIPRGRKFPLFEIYFEETNVTYNKLDLEYVLKYSMDVPLKYHELKARYIVALAREAGILALEDRVRATEKEPESNNELIGKKTETEPDVPSVKASKKKKQKVDSLDDFNEDIPLKTPQKKKQRAEVLDDFNEDEMFVNSDVEIDFEDEEEGADELQFEELDVEVLNTVDDTPADQSYDWQFGKPPVRKERQFLGSFGNRHLINPESGTPFEYFCLFIPIWMWTKIAGYTNKKAEMFYEDKKLSSSGRIWYPTSGAEIRAWFASILWWCIIRSFTFEQFFRSNMDAFRPNRWFNNFTRWQQIKRFLKLSDPTKDKDNIKDRLFRVRELFQTFIEACRGNFWPGANVSLDEAIKKFKGRCHFKQYIKNKPVRWGLKIFCLCCSATAYLWNAVFYLGKQVEFGKDDKETSTTFRTVMELLNPLQGLHHHVHMDNYYTSIPLFDELSTRQIWSTGTIRTNRKGLDKAVTIKKAEERQLAKQPGYCRFSSRGDLVYCAWYDKRPVHMLTNFYDVEGEDFVEHWYPAKEGEQPQTASGKVKKSIFIPPVVKQYRKNMGGVDTFDQLRSYVNLEMRSLKYWHPMMYFIFEAALVNSWVLYKSNREKAGLEVEYSHVDFRKAICIGLASEWEASGCSYRAPCISPTKDVTENKQHKSRRSIAMSMDCGDRFTAPDKHVGFQERIPILQGSTQKRARRQMLCANCSKHKTSQWCRKCSAPLCDTRCWIYFHTRGLANGFKDM
jgi:hypothetical protein